jgi:hypothetical protein
MQILKLRGRSFCQKFWLINIEILLIKTRIECLQSLILYPCFVSIVTKISTLFIFHVLYFVKNFQVRLIKERKRIKVSKFFLSLCDNRSANGDSCLASKLVKLVKYLNILNITIIFKEILNNE